MVVVRDSCKVWWSVDVVALPLFHHVLFRHSDTSHHHSGVYNKHQQRKTSEGVGARTKKAVIGGQLRCRECH